jgi:DMSO/TMAO reductase YedYZ heme-binding membrane subunit
MSMSQTQKFLAGHKKPVKAILLVLAVMHGTIVFAMHHYRDHPATWLIGPIALGAMIITVSMAANRKSLPALWRRVHQLNYLIFAAVYVKAILIGTIITASNAAATALLTILSLEMAAVAAATIVRISTRTKAPAGQVARA